MTVRRVIVTGGASGIGAAAAARFAATGAVGVVLDREAASGLPAGWTSVAVDVTDADAVAAAFASALETLGGLDVLVAAAGIVPAWQPTGELSLADFDRTMAVNVRGVVASIEQAAPALGADGAIVVVGSLNSWKGDPNLTAYAASKHAVLGVVRSAALSLGPRGIRVNAVAPGPVATEALQNRVAARVEQSGGGGRDVDHAFAALAAGTALRRIATIDDVVDAIDYLAGPRSAAITGHLLPVDGGIA